MRALVNYENGEGKVKLMDVPKPVPAPDQVCIRVAFAGICGTDMHIYKNDGGYPTKPPITLGHEFSGVVESVGADVDPSLIGKRVVSETYFHTCGKCMYCQTGHKNLCAERLSIGSGVDGAMADYVVVPAKNLHFIPDNLSMEEAAMTEPLACCVQAVLEFGNIKAGDKVLITGPGAIGLLCLQVAISCGAVVSIAGISKDELRLKKGLELGAKNIIYTDDPNVEQTIREIFGEYGPDLVFDCSGAGPAINFDLKTIRKGGRFVQVGLTGKPTSIDMNLITLKQLSVFGTFAQNVQWWDRALELMAEQKVKVGPLVSEPYPIERWEEAFADYIKGQGFKYLLSLEAEDVHVKK